MRKVKWGVIGAGGIADRRTLPGMMLSDNCELVAVMEVNEELSKKLAEKYGARYYYTKVEDLLNNNEIEAVYIASPVAFHKKQIIQAAKAGKHILCEKPIAISFEESLQAYNSCRENNVLAAAGFMMRYHSLHKAIKQIIAEKKIGQIVSCRLQMSCWFPFIEGNWRQQFKNTGGGELMDMGIGYPLLVKSILGYENLNEYEFYNRGISGNRIVDVYARIKSDIINLKPDYMSILIGVNDVWHEFGRHNGVDADKFYKIYCMLIEEIKEALPNVKIMILEPFCLRERATENTEEDPQKWEIFNEEVKKRALKAKEVAEKYNIPFIPLQNDFDKVSQNTENSYWLHDGVHPTPMGHELIKRKWLKKFEEIK